jgi:hypothetical protein
MRGPEPREASTWSDPTVARSGPSVSPCARIRPRPHVRTDVPFTGLAGLALRLGLVEGLGVVRGGAGGRQHGGQNEITPY